MAFFRLVPVNDAYPQVRGHGFLLRPPQLDDYEPWAALREASRDFLLPWEPIWPADDLTRAAFRRRLRRYAEEIRSDGSYPFFIFREADSALIGGLTIGQIRRGVAMTGTVGYWVGAPYARQGMMTVALRLALKLAFDQLGLRRVEAACLPDNAASIALLEKVGFSREGLAREYLCIAGTWRDHLLYAMLRTDFSG